MSCLFIFWIQNMCLLDIKLDTITLDFCFVHLLFVIFQILFYYFYLLFFYYFFNFSFNYLLIFCCGFSIFFLLNSLSLSLYQKGRKIHALLLFLIFIYGQLIWLTICKKKSKSQLIGNYGFHKYIKHDLKRYEIIYS